MIMLTSEQKVQVTKNAIEMLRGYNDQYPCMGEEIDVACMMLDMLGFSEEEINAILVEAGIYKSTL
jgi:hypothetical protein